MIQYQLKLKPKSGQEEALNEWLWNLTGVWNWAIRKIELDARNGIYHSQMSFQNLLAHHGKKLGIPSHTLQGMLLQAHVAWTHCFHKTKGKPRLKGQRNKLSSIPFPDPIKSPTGNRIKLPGLGSTRFHKQEIPKGEIKCGRIVKKASGWYLCLNIDAEPKTIKHTAEGQIGIDPGFTSLLTLSTGEKIQNPKELAQAAKRLAQAQRGRNKKLAARIQERIANRRKDRNHKLSRRLIAENQIIVFSADNHKEISRKFGKSVASAGHAQLQSMLTYKSTTSGRVYIEVNPRFSTMTCSTCGCLSGPKGLAGLSVRQWECGECGTLHDRDVNAAINTLTAGAGAALERSCSVEQVRPKSSGEV